MNNRNFFTPESRKALQEEIINKRKNEWKTMKENTEDTENIEGVGPGTELKKLLSRIGITSTPSCSCNKKAKIMDEKGVDWCQDNIDEIDSWLSEEAKKRKLPYFSLAGKTLIHIAIRKARKKL